MAPRLYIFAFIALGVFGAALLLSARADTSTSTVAAEYGPADAKNTPIDERDVPPRPVRRARSSTSMPYFSFAQSLTPRS